MLTDSTTLISVSSSYFIIFHRPGSEGNTSCVFCRVGGQAACWVLRLDCLRPVAMGAACTRLSLGTCDATAVFLLQEKQTTTTMFFIAPGHTCWTVNTAFFKLLFLRFICHFRNLASARSGSSNKLLHTQTNRLAMEKHCYTVNS